MKAREKGRERLCSLGELCGRVRPHPGAKAASRMGLPNARGLGPKGCSVLPSAGHLQGLHFTAFRFPPFGWVGCLSSFCSVRQTVLPPLF